MRSLIVFAAGRRTKFLICAVALVLFGVAGSFAGQLSSVQKNDSSSFLPGSAESSKALAEIKRYPSGEVAPAVVVYRRDGGLNAVDKALIATNRTELNASGLSNLGRFGPAALSRDGTSALLTAPVRASGGDSNKFKQATTRIHTVIRVPASDPGLVSKLTGPAGFSADAIDVFQSINGTLLVATLALVFVLLILIYRSPVFWFIPFITVLFAEVASRALAVALAKAGVTVNGQSAGILPVLVFGAGTDYALLLVARFREELRRHEDKHEAMAVALGKAGPAIVASGLTVMLALLCLTLAQVNGTAGLGPIGAMGIALAMIAMMTVLPALLVVCGRRAFWPFIPHVGDEKSDEAHGVWRRVAERESRHPRRVWVGTAAVLAFFCLGLSDLNTKLTQGNSFRGEVDSVQGQKLLSRAFPAGSNTPVDIIVHDPTNAPAVQQAVTRIPQVAFVKVAERGAPGVRLEATLNRDPYSVNAFDLIPGIRQAARSAGGQGTLVGGGTAQEGDLRVASARDTRLIVPIALLVVLVILILLLRALVAPLLLIATVILSFGAALGIGAFFFSNVFGFPGSDPSFPLFVFIFLVALGVDYNIFLMARVREESLVHGTRQGMLRGLAVTGAVITSAGIVLAGTFSSLAVLPLVFLTELGFTIAVGVLLDTFIVRSILVPALTFDLGARIWWPSTLARPADHSRSARRADEAKRPARGA